MPERLDYVTIALRLANVTISWDSRQALMAMLHATEVRPSMMTLGASSAGIIAAFAAVGTTQPVELTPSQQHLLLELLRQWSGYDRWSPEPDGRMTADLITLRDALVDGVTLHQAAIDARDGYRDV